MSEELLNLYRNYIFAIKEREEYGSKYGDTDEIIEIYENKLSKVLKKDKRGLNYDARKNNE